MDLRPALEVLAIATPLGSHPHNSSAWQPAHIYVTESHDHVIAFATFPASFQQSQKGNWHGRSQV